MDCILDIRNTDKYLAWYTKVLIRKESLGFKQAYRQRANKDKVLVNKIIQALKREDKALVYRKAAKRQGYARQLYDRFSRDRFLSNANLINETAILRVTRQMPKGAYNYIYFNTNLPSDYLLSITKRILRMFISSDRPLFSKANYNAYKI